MSEMSELIFLKPVLKEMIWGGDRLKEFGYDIPSDHTGECWGISAHPNGDCVVEGGTFDGWTLSALWEKHRELFGGVDQDRFPLLVKIIDAKKDLSIQVHPDDAYAREHEHGSLGKTECWYVLDCDPQGEIVIGHHAKDKDELREMIEQKRWNDLIRTIPVKKGDFFQINPGCVHAIKAGTLILETQQNSDITYRVYDYDRLSDGKPRQLHIRQSIDVIQAPYEASAVKPEVTKEGKITVTSLVRCPYYEVKKMDVDGIGEIQFQKPFVNVSVIEGSGTINGREIRKGNHFIIPAEYGTIRLEGTLSMIVSSL